MPEEHENADEILNRKRFSDLRAALRIGRDVNGACPMHVTITDSNVLQLEATEAILVDVRSLRVSVAALQRDVRAAFSRDNAVAGAEVELEQKVGRIARMAGGSSPWMWISLMAVSAMLTIWKAKGWI